MAEVRKFGLDTATPIPGLKGIKGSMIQITRQRIEELGEAEAIRRFNGMPLVLDRSDFVVIHHHQADSEMHEHSAPFPILFIVLSGSGFVRLGGPTGETVQMSGGEAILWPANVEHKVWTEGEAMEALLVNYAE